MRFLLEHRTSYAFDAPVYLEPQTIRLRPRSDAATHVIDFRMEIDPLPVVRAENLDIEGNLVVMAWFHGASRQLDIRTRATVDTLVADPFRYLLAEPDRTLPYAYPPDVGERLRSYRREPDAAHASVRAIAVEAAGASDRSQAGFPFTLARQIHRDFTLEGRPEGAPQSPEETVARGAGACRDLAVLFVECCRAMGLAARFVSGYAYTDDATPAEMHAWGEVYLAGGGWRGYDPSRGLAAGDQHVTLAAAGDPADAAPVSGTFRADGVKSRLETELTMRAVPKPSPPTPGDN